MQYTDNYGLRKPQAAETANYQDLNYNSDKIDSIMADNRQISVAMYVSGNTYNTGDLAGHENASHHIQVFKCNTDGTTGSWDSTKWSLTNLATEIKIAAASGGDNANQNIADDFDATSTYAVGDYVIYNSILYKCVTAVSVAGAWDSTKWQSCVVTDEMGSGGGGGSSTFAGLTDVSLTNLTDGDFPQYDSSTQKWKNVAITGVSVQPVIYSTEEREVGVWTDGKPLYQKTIPIDSLPNNTSRTYTTPSNLDNVIDARGYVISSNTQSGISVRIMPFAAGGLNDIRVDINDGSLRITTFGNWSGYSGYITIYYTKTTDTAGSGTWTPSGVPAVHYSTTEQVVGTDENGNTIYERTYTGLSVNTNGTNWVQISAIDTSGMADIVECTAYTNTPTGKLHIALGEYVSTGSVLQLTVVGSVFNRTVNVIVLRYTKSSS